MILSTTIIFAQEENSTILLKNELYVELLGTGAPYSVNYARQFLHKEKLQFWLKAGGGYLGQLKILSNISDYGMVNATLEPKIMYGSRFHQLEIGLSYLYIYYFDITLCEPELPQCHMFSHSLIPRIGYRYFLNNERWFLSLAWTPVFEIALIDPGYPTTSDNYWLYGGIGVGWRF